MKIYHKIGLNEEQTLFQWKGIASKAVSFNRGKQLREPRSGQRLWKGDMCVTY